MRLSRQNTLRGILLVLFLGVLFVSGSKASTLSSTSNPELQALADEAARHDEYINSTVGKEHLAFCESLSGTSCEKCTGDNIVGGCYYCPSTMKCSATLNIVDCPQVPWIHNGNDCAYLNNTALNPNETCKSDPNVGCTNNNAYNYKLRATEDDGSCVYLSGISNSTDNCSKQCVCEAGGVFKPYGKYCAKSYTGCPGEQACDAVDFCCQMHDWCVTEETYVACTCNYQLSQCIKGITEADINASFCPEYVRETIKTIHLEVMSVLPADCLAQTPEPMCFNNINCHGIGNCTYTGGCACPPGGFYNYDTFNRTDCSCAPGYGPSCGPNPCSQRIS